MKLFSVLLVCLACGAGRMAAQSNQPSASGGQTQGSVPTKEPPEATTPGSGDLHGRSFEILSDTHGVDFNPYVRGILRTIYAGWLRLMPDEAKPPTRAKGETAIRFSISPDGQILAMHLDSSTHDDLLNRAAWGAITGVGQFPPLPASFKGPDLELRVHFLVNTPPAGSGEQQK